MKRTTPFRTLLIIAFLGLSTFTARAEGWHKVGSFTAGGGPKDAAVKRICSDVLVRPSNGRVDIKSITVNTASGKKTLPGGQFEKGNKTPRSIGEESSVDSIQITDGGEGNYDVYVK